MPQTPDWNKYLDAGAEFVAMTRTQARQRAKELVSQGQLAQEQVQGFVDELVDESRRRTDVLLDVVRKEIQRQVKTLGIATKDDLAKLETKLAQADRSRRRQVGGEEGERQEGATKKTDAAKKADEEGDEEGAKATKTVRRSRRRKRPRRPLPSGVGRIVRRRLDVELVRRGLVTQPDPGRRGGRGRAGSPSAARRRGRSRARSTSTSRSCVTGDPPRFVSRGGEKLDAALERFGGRRHRGPGPRRRRVHGRLHRLPAPAGRGDGGRGRRRPRPARTGRCARIPG